MASATEIPPQPTATRGQAAELAIVACPKCGADQRRVGFITETIQYQSYTPDFNGKIVRHSSRKSGLHQVKCGLCNAQVDVDLKVLTGVTR